MEAVAAVGLASNVLQFISFARELVSKTKQIQHNEHGSLDQIIELEKMAKHIGRLSSRLAVRDGIKQDEDEETRALQRLCDGCQHIADDLTERIKKLRDLRKGSGSGLASLGALRQAFSLMWGAHEFIELEQRMDRYQKTINTTLLASLRKQIAQAEQERVDRDKQMSELLLGSVDSTKAWQAALIDTLHRNDWKPENKSDAELFSRRLINGAKLDKDTSYQREIHHLLQFEEISERHETIAKAHTKTFQWVFVRDHQKRFSRNYESRREPSSPTPNQGSHPEPSIPAPQYNNFAEWLRGSESLYWITGKPGSGKSTLMKYLYEEPRTSECLRAWSGTKDPIIAGFFFWNSGTSIQMSKIGLLRTLLYQCLQGHRDLIPSLFPIRWTSYSLFGGDDRQWTWSELTAAIKSLFMRKDHKLLLFIDGLDEFDGNPSDLLELVHGWTNVGKDSLKLCIASRPWLVFEEKLRGGSNHQVPWLRMEDLTIDDIQIYVEESMNQSSQWTSFVGMLPQEADKMIQEILEKAVGVFLWVSLVVDSLLAGLRDGDSIDDLWVRVHGLPSKLEDLFQSILDRLPKEYFKEACEMFQLVSMAFEPLALLEISFALEEVSVALRAPIGSLENRELDFRAEMMRRRLLSRSKGLLESPTYHHDQERAKVTYLHRTVRDFFMSPEASTYIKAGATDYQAHLHLAVSSLRMVKVSTKRLSSIQFDDFWRSSAHCIGYVKKQEKTGSPIPHEILDNLERAGDEYWSQKPHNTRLHDSWLSELIDVATSVSQPDNADGLWRDSELTSWDTIRQLSTSDEIVNGENMKVFKSPHWVNSIHLATLFSNSGKELQELLAGWLLGSFYELAFLAGLESYVSATLPTKIGGELSVLRCNVNRRIPFLAWSLMNRDLSMARGLLSGGVNPNAGMGERATVWTQYLRLARRDFQKVSEEEQCVLRQLAEIMMSYGADPAHLHSRDFAELLQKMESERLKELKTGFEKMIKEQKKEKTRKQNSQKRTSGSLMEVIKRKVKAYIESDDDE